LLRIGVDIGRVRSDFGLKTSIRGTTAGGKMESTLVRFNYRLRQVSSLTVCGFDGWLETGRDEQKYNFNYAKFHNYIQKIFRTSQLIEIMKHQQYTKKLKTITKHQTSTTNI